MPSRKPKDDAELTPDAETKDALEDVFPAHLVDEPDEPADVVEEPAKPRGEPVCPLCGGALIKHLGGGFTEGASHCNHCGSCWAPGLEAQRAGHTPPTSWSPA